MPLNILLVDDDDVAAESIHRSMHKTGFNCPVTVAEDGQVALEILRGMHADKKLNEPLVVLLDLNMPRMNGFEFLQAIRADEILKPTVVFVLTTSNSEEDKAKAYRENVAGYLVKNKVGPQFSKLFSLLNNYCSVVSFPEQCLN